MTSRYRVEYALKSHRRDEFIEWIKGLLAVPFVLHADVNNYGDEISPIYNNFEKYEKYIESNEEELAKECQKRYLEIFGDVELLIDNTILLDRLEIEKGSGQVSASRLRQVVPSVGRFYTRLPLRKAFLIEDDRKQISKRRLVSPSFNDIRSILSTAQILALSKIYKNGDVSGTKLKLITFDGDVTLYDDGKSLSTGNEPVVKRLLKLLELDIFVAIVTAAGYPGQEGVPKYYERLKGLIDAVTESKVLSPHQKENFLVMGGESNYLFRYNNEMKNLKFIEGDEWYLPVMENWSKDKINFIMNLIHRHLIHLRRKFNLDSDEKTTIIKKERSIGIIPAPGFEISREQLEEIVLSCSLKLTEISNKYDHNLMPIQLRKKSDSGVPTTSIDSQPEHEGSKINFCAFNGGRDVWVDVGDKSLGVECLQKYLCKDEKYNHICPIQKSESLHIGDQFASLGANDFKARLSACTVWIANPKETVAILDDLLHEIGVSL